MTGAQPLRAAARMIADRREVNLEVGGVLALNVALER